MADIDEYRRLNTRAASILQVGGFRPAGDRFASNFGLRVMGAPDLGWPSEEGRPLMFICQLNLTAAPAVPELLQDIQLITFFADAEGTLGQDNGENWRLFAYPSLDGLIEMTRPAGAPALGRGFECRWEAQDDHPKNDDPSRVAAEDFDDSGVDLENLHRTKIGGYASTIQSEPWWCLEEHPAAPAYCLQIDSEEKVRLAWGDGGTVYLARGTTDGFRDRWFADWQCY